MQIIENPEDQPQTDNKLAVESRRQRALERLSELVNSANEEIALEAATFLATYPIYEEEDSDRMA